MDGCVAVVVAEAEAVAVAVGEAEAVAVAVAEAVAVAVAVAAGDTSPVATGDISKKIEKLAILILPELLGLRNNT